MTCGGVPNARECGFDCACHQLPAATRLLVRAPRTDRFSADSWWRSREESREVFMEYLRWFNTFILHDP